MNDVDLMSKIEGPVFLITLYNTELQETRKTDKKWVFWTSETVLRRFTAWFRRKWTKGMTWAILEVSNTTPSSRKPNKLSKKGIFRTSETILWRFTAWFRGKWTQGVTLAILEVSNTTPSCRKPDKLSKNRVFLTSETVLRRFTD